VPLHDHVFAGGTADRHGDLDALVEERELSLDQLPHRRLVRGDLAVQALVLGLEVVRGLDLRGASNDLGSSRRPGELVPARHAQLLEHIAQVSFHRPLGDRQLGGDLVSS
jgi:hypothetical protein